MFQFNDWIDLYLYVAKDSTIRGYKQAVTDYVSNQSSDTLQQIYGKIPTAEIMLNKFGRFIINNNDIYYIPPQTTARSPTKVLTIVLSSIHDTIVGRADGKIIQSIALLQLLIMLKTHSNELLSHFYESLINKQNELYVAISKNRDAINETL